MVVALAVVLAGCAMVQPQVTWLGEISESATPDSSDPAASATTASATPVLGGVPLAVGECTGAVDFAAGSLVQVPTVPCAQAHSWEVSAVIDVPSPTFPGSDAIASMAETSCEDSFTDYVGVARTYSRYAAAYLAADAAAWANPALRTVTCLVGSADGGLVGSARGDTRLFPVEGQCTGPQDVAATEVELIDCASRHYYEVFTSKQVSGKKAPTAAEEQKLFTSVCLAGFTTFVGLDSGKSKYEVTYFLADADLWKKVGDHRIVCSAGSPDGGIKGSLKGKKK